MAFSNNGLLLKLPDQAADLSLQIQSFYQTAVDHALSSSAELIVESLPFFTDVSEQIKSHDEIINYGTIASFDNDFDTDKLNRVLIHLEVERLIKLRNTEEFETATKKLEQISIANQLLSNVVSMEIKKPLANDTHFRKKRHSEIDYEKLDFVTEVKFKYRNLYQL